MTWSFELYELCTTYTFEILSSSNSGIKIQYILFRKHFVCVTKTKWQLV